MLQLSFYSVFEKMWEYVLAKCSNYASIEALDNHIENQSNPHDVTAEQIGLSNVDNTSDLEKPISYAVQEVFDDHTFNMENPHNVTAEQVGALPLTEVLWKMQLQ